MTVTRRSTGVPPGSPGPRGRLSAAPAGDPAEDRGGSVPSRAGAEPPHAPEQEAERARAVCLRLLTGAPRTRRQLSDALRTRGFSERAIASVLDRFEEVGLIDDAAFADAWVESRHHGRGLARKALAGELRRRGVDPATVDRAVSRLDSEQEEETARALVARRLRATRGLEEGKRLRRLVGMLARKGYPEGVALRVVREALREEGEDPEMLERLFPDGAV
ncbi:recombination regulator RecX [Streptomyces sp. 6N223]|uniref:recombination regulator RecX n=1 Tax=Streptomyces sp. 6N223 TaxID=3457412 RepID=UPI003FD02AA7